jgi:alkylated DNA repair dioxygenase AlkB
MNFIQSLPLNRSISTDQNAGKIPAGNLSLRRAQGRLKPTIEVIEPGLVILRNFVEDSECEKIAQTALEWGRQGEDGFYTTNDKGQVVLNTGEKGRGRIYDVVTRFPTSVSDKCKMAVKHARRSADPAMPKMQCTHLLLNMYTTNEGLVWHRDIYKNDGKSDHPVVKMCIGASCRFGFKLCYATL